MSMTSNFRRMSSRSTNTSGTGTTDSSQRYNSETTDPEMQSRGFADLTNIRIPIVGYEVMDARARFTVSLFFFFLISIITIMKYFFYLIRCLNFASRILSPMIVG